MKIMRSKKIMVIKMYTFLLRIVLNHVCLNLQCYISMSNNGIQLTIANDPSIYETMQFRNVELLDVC